MNILLLMVHLPKNNVIHQDPSELSLSAQPCQAFRWNMPTPKGGSGAVSGDVFGKSASRPIPPFELAEGKCTLWLCQNSYGKWLFSSWIFPLIAW